MVPRGQCLFGHNAVQQEFHTFDKGNAAALHKQFNRIIVSAATKAPRQIRFLVDASLELPANRAEKPKDSFDLLVGQS